MNGIELSVEEIKRPEDKRRTIAFSKLGEFVHDGRIFVPYAEITERGLNLTGGSDASVISQKEWLDIYEDFQRSATGEIQNLSPSEKVITEIVSHIDRNLIPISIAVIEYDKPSKRILAGILKYIKDEQLFPEIKPSDMETNVAVFSSGHVPVKHREFSTPRYVHYGKNAQFIIPASLFKSNLYSKTGEFLVDFGDGRGFLTVHHDEIIRVHYPISGNYEINIRAEFGGKTQTTRFTISVNVIQAPTPNETWDLTGVKIGGYDTANGTAHVFYGSGHTSLTNPFIMAAGFPGNWSLDQFWTDIQEMATPLLDAGYDLILVTYTTGGNYVQSNAGVLVSCIRKAMADGRQSVVSGLSMGGLITRYALLWMENNQEPHNAKVFFTMDTPHDLGANIPLSIQKMLTALKAMGRLPKSDQDMLDQLYTSAAEQMLYLNCPDYKHDGAIVSEKRENLLSEMKQMGGFPTQIRVSYALASGSGNASKPSEMCKENDWVITWYSGASWSTRLCGIRLSALPADNQKHDLAMFNIPNVYVFKDGLNVKVSITMGDSSRDYDSVAGSYENTWKQVGDGLPSSGYHKSVTSTLSAFVPTQSAIGVSGDIHGIPTTSPFTEFKCNKTCKDHLEFDNESVTWILEKLQEQLLA